MLDYNTDHYCPVYDRIISSDLCYDSLCCLNFTFLVSSTKELKEVKDIGYARMLCNDCPYSDLGDGL